MTTLQILWLVLIVSFVLASTCGVKAVLNGFSGPEWVGKVLAILAISSYASALIAGLGLVYIALGHIA